jgi:hypothetical protein
MADIKISALPAGTANASAVVPATNAAGTTTEKITLGAIAALGGGAPADGSVTTEKIDNTGSFIAGSWFSNYEDSGVTYSAAINAISTSSALRVGVFGGASTFAVSRAGIVTTGQWQATPVAAAYIGTHASSHQTGQADAIAPVIVTPSSLSSSQNDYAPGVCDILRLTSSTAIDLTGLVAGTVDGALRLIINTNASGGAAITLKHESSSSTAANRFRSSFGSDVVLTADGGSVLLTYSNAISRWRIL